MAYTDLEVPPNILVAPEMLVIGTSHSSFILFGDFVHLPRKSQNEWICSWAQHLFDLTANPLQ